MINGGVMIVVMMVLKVMMFVGNVTSDGNDSDGVDSNGGDGYDGDDDTHDGTDDGGS
jgi:hypothetical protein